MRVLGITGIAGAGKTNVLDLLNKTFHIPTWSADDVVRKLYQNEPHLFDDFGLSIPEIKTKALSEISFLKKIEQILHPRVRQSMELFLADQASQGVPLCALEIPLLFEKGWDNLCHKVIVVDVSAEDQTRRLVDRGLNDQQINFINGCQWSREAKSQKADIVISGLLSPHEQIQILTPIVKDLVSHA